MESIIQEVMFESPCPCKKCLNKTAIYKWTHSKCKSFVTINSDLYIKCLLCNRTIEYEKYPFKCSEHEHREPPSKEGSIYAFNVMKNFSQDELTKEYISLIIKNVQKKFQTTPHHNTIQNENPYHNTIQEKNPYHNTIQNENPHHNTIQEKNPYHNTIQEKNPRHNTIQNENPHHNTIQEKNPYHNTIQEEHYTILDKNENETPNKIQNETKNDIQFISTCPVKTCIDNDQLNFWCHPDPSCKGELTLDIEGDIHCSKCGLIISFVDFPFQCDNHVGYDYATPEGILNAMESLKEIYSQDANKSELFFETLTVNLITKYMQLSDNELEEIEFVAPCPCQECHGKSQFYNWKHPNCGGKLQLTITGEIKCIRCEEKQKFIDWPFNCDKHENTKSSTEGMQHCFQGISLNANCEKKQEFIAKVTSIVINQFIDTKNINQCDEIEFIAPCPADECKTKTEMIEWKHENCGGVLLLTIEGYIKCKKCNESSLFVKWPFSCGEHENILPSIQGTCNSLGKLSYNKEQNETHKNFILQITSTIMQQFLNK